MGVHVKTFPHLASWSPPPPVPPALTTVAPAVPDPVAPPEADPVRAAPPVAAPAGAIDSDRQRTIPLPVSDRPDDLIVSWASEKAARASCP